MAYVYMLYSTHRFSSFVVVFGFGLCERASRLRLRLELGP